MKRVFILATIVFAFLAENARSQIEINAFTGYVPASTTAYSYNGYRLRIDGSQNFGAGIGIRF